MIPAGGSGQLVARVHTNTNQQGRMAKSVLVTTDAPGAETLRLALSFNLVAPVQVKPRSTLFIDTVEGEPQSAKVLLQRSDGEPLEIRRVDVGRPELITVRLEPGSEAGEVWLEASFDPRELQRAAIAQSTRLAVHTNHPEQPVIQLPVNVRIRPLIDPRPSRLTLWVPAEEGGSPFAPLQLIHRRGRAFEINKLVTSHPRLFTAEATSSGPQTTHNIRIRLVEGVEDAALRLPIQGTLTISSSDPDRPEINVPVIVTKRRVARRP